MMESIANATFQQARSEFAEIAKFLIKELAANITNLEDHIYMQPVADLERRSNREPYREFRRAFSDLYLLTNNIVRDKELKQAIELWFSETLFKSETKNEDFTIGISFARQYLTQMYLIGLLDLNVSEPVDFPFQDIICDVEAENTFVQQMMADISRGNLSPNPGITAADISEDPRDISKLVGIVNDMHISDDEEENYDQFAGTQNSMAEAEDDEDDEDDEDAD